MYELRVRSRIPSAELESKVGKVLGPSDFNVLVTRDAIVRLAGGGILFIYLRQALTPSVVDPVRPILSSIKAMKDNRAHASGGRTRMFGKQKRRLPVPSNTVGAIESTSGRNYRCRLTEWTGKHLSDYAALYPLCGEVDAIYQRTVPERYLAQREYAKRTRPEWMIPGTVFTTITVNNTFPTGVHRDAGDLDEGFSCLSVLRKGHYTGGVLVFPEYRIGVDLQDRDLVLMNAHEWHGNTLIENKDAEAERISVVYYYRTNMVTCGSPSDELEKQQRQATNALREKVNA